MPGPGPAPERKLPGREQGEGLLAWLDRTGEWVLWLSKVAPDRYVAKLDHDGGRATAEGSSVAELLDNLQAAVWGGPMPEQFREQRVQAEIARQEARQKARRRQQRQARRERVAAGQSARQSARAG